MASIWPRMRRTRLSSFIFSRIVCDMRSFLSVLYSVPPYNMARAMGPSQVPCLTSPIGVLVAARCGHLGDLHGRLPKFARPARDNCFARQRLLLVHSVVTGHDDEAHHCRCIS